jgi:cell wall-associated NlpC family hydrolase
LAQQQVRVGLLQASMGQLAAARYRAGGVDETLQLILSDDPTTFLDQASSLDQIGRRQDTALRRVTVARQQLAQDKLAVAQQVGQLAKVKKQLQAQKRAVEGKLAEAKRLLNSLRAEERARLLAAQRAARLRALAAARAAAAERASRDEERSSDSGDTGDTGGGSGGSSGGSSDSGGGGDSTYDGPASGRAAVAVRTAFAQLGDPYVWAADGPGSFDCSGLTSYAWRAAGVSLPHSSRAQYASGRKVSRSDLRPGDLVFFYHPISHVGIYIGGGRMIHAPHPGASVTVASISRGSYAGAIRP